MKYNKFLFAFAILAIMASCQPEKFDGIGEPTNNLALLGGTWKISKVTQRDEDATRKGFPFTSLDITSAFNPNTTLTLQPYQKGDQAGFTFTGGDFPVIGVPTSGKWGVDNEEAPKTLKMIGSSNTSSVNLGPVNSLTNNKLVLRVVRSSAGKDQTSYNIEFNKQ
jgi:hypothetical protein